MTELSAIQLEDVVKEYLSHGEVVQAVKGVSLDIAEGEFFSLLGPSGCGKTTTMRMVAGFEEPTKGLVRLHGKDVTNVPPNKRDVNMVFQSYALFPHMSVWDNVAFGLKQRKTPQEEIRRRVGEMLEIVDLAGREKRRPREMSGGQQQRVALARALVNRPRALLLDEPLGALDLKLRQAMQIELKRIQREVGITFVYVTHDQSEALTMSDRIAVMNDGLVEQLASPREIYERPATAFVAGFIGTSNLITGTVAGGVLEIGGGRVLVPGHEGDVTVTVRPEKITICPDEPGRGLSAVPGTVTEMVYLGTSNSYAVKLADGADITVFEQNAHDATATAERGDSVWLSWEAQHSYVIGS
ncbi:ABC transporter ATP-binding protein [Nonomuraea spiralis]|uniref:ABC transporter ATP-binding protein n=1 Tax=Nonomuraea TaxID=83681 RepID=UPI000F7AD06A|nr:ABC transporter ATP-binding protein [Nonomuraea sp. WAC 01424]RSN14005.1 spermidine/putrescine ABC transporter ATP-binding protein [Nonomuraea sp. WAC 01424]